MSNSKQTDNDCLFNSYPGGGRKKVPISLAENKHIQISGEQRRRKNLTGGQNRKKTLQVAPEMCPLSVRSPDQGGPFPPFLVTLSRP